MPVNLEPNEIEDFLRQGHTVIMTTIGKDGFPHSVPLWYAYIDGQIMVRKQKKSQGVRNISRDDRVCCLVETGEAWVDLKAVMIRGRAVEVTDEETLRRFREEQDSKYADFRPASVAMPDRTRQHYAQERVLYRIVPEKKTVSWWNRKIRMASSQPGGAS